MSEQGKTYTSFIADEYKAERERRTQADSRGGLLVTTSTSVVTLLAAVVTFFRAGSNHVFPRAALPWLVIALVMLSLAAMAGIVASWNRAYQVADVSTLEKLLRDRWAVDDEIDARNNIGAIHVKSIVSLREVNDWKAVWITVGLVAQVVALVTLGVVVCVLLASSVGGR